MKRFRFSLLIFVFGLLLLFPYNTNALGNKVATCNYEFTNQNGKDISLKYNIYSDGSVDLPFSDGTLYARDGASWYHSDAFASSFYDASKVSSSTVTCPSIYVQENDLGVTVYPYPLNNDSCSGHCYNITASSPKLSSWAKDSGVKSKKVVSTCTGSSMGFYSRQSYVYPTFRLFSDGSKEWSVDGKNFVSVNKAISGTVAGEKFSITVNDSLLNSVFSNSKASCPSQIYRCVTSSNGGYSYELSRGSSFCTNDELSTSDGQQFGSKYASGAFGEPTDNSSNSSGSSSGHGSESYSKPDSELTTDDLKDDFDFSDDVQDCNSLLGSTQDEESVAWLLQQILNYVKILGPILVVILSSLDFAKAIVASDDDNMKKAEKKLVIRLILAVALFLIPTLVSVLLNIFGITTDQICALS